MIQFEHVTKSYGKTPVLKDLSFTIEDGQFVVLIGPSGCGKTTTLKTINRLIDIDSGTISIDGQDIRQRDKVDLRRHIGYVIQQIGLFPNMTVAQNICVVPKLLKYDKSQCDEIVRELLKMVNMEQYADKYPSELSGGQQQRIGVLRALAASPPIVLMDEPFSALDPMTRETLQDEVKNHEPLAALDGGRDGLDFYRRICREAPDYLAPGGCLLFEIGWKQKDGVSALLAEYIGEPFAMKDYGDNWRVAGAVKR